MRADRRDLRRAALAAVLAGALALARAEVAAQPTPADDCNLASVNAIDAATLDPGARAALPSQAFRGMETRIRAGEWLALVDSITASFEVDSLVPDSVRPHFGRQLHLLRDELAAIARSPDAERLRLTAEGVRQVRFRISPSPNGRFFLFRAGPDEIALHSLASPARRALCWRAMALDRLLVAYGAPAREEAVRALGQAVQRWDNYGEKGYSQFPWELAINSARFDARATDPPRSQLVVLHPALAIELAGKPRELQRVDALTLEPIGYLRYTASRAHYFGASALLSLPSDRRVGIGVLAHVGQYGKVGYVFLRARDAAGDRDPNVVVSADLYQFLSEVPDRIRQAKARAVTQLLGNIRLAGDSAPRPSQ